MLDLERIIRAAARCAEDERAVVAAPYDLSEIRCRELVDQGVFGGYIANSAPDPSDLDPRIAGWWIDRGEGLWYIRHSIASTLVLLSASTHQEIGADLLLEARRKGIARMLLVGSDGSVLREIDPREAPAYRMKAPERSKHIGDLCYEKAFEEIFGRIGNRLRLPSDSFDPNRLLLIVGSLGPGGSERQASYTAAGLARRRAFDVHVGCNFVEHPADLFRPIVEAAGAKVWAIARTPPEHHMPVIVAARQRLAPYAAMGVQNVFEAVLQYASLIRRVRPAIVHTWTDYGNILAGIAAELVGVPALVLSGRSVAPDNFPLLFQPYMRAGYQSLFRRRDVVFLNNSQAGAADYARWLDLPPDDFEVVHNGFDFPAAAPPRAARLAVRCEHGIPQDALVVGSIIRFSEEKRPQLFLEMARVLHAAHPQLRFLVFGEGSMLEEMRAWVENQGLAEIIKLPGLTEDAWAALAAMDLFVLASRMEGFPNVLVEAQASGLPVVCTGAGGMDETFIEGETGFAVRAATAEGLADAVSRLICQPALRAVMSARAFAQAREAFGIDRMLDRTVKCYQAAYGRVCNPVPA